MESLLESEVPHGSPQNEIQVYIRSAPTCLKYYQRLQCSILVIMHKCLHTFKNIGPSPCIDLKSLLNPRGMSIGHS